MPLAHTPPIAALPQYLVGICELLLMVTISDCSCSITLSGIVVTDSTWLLPDDDWKADDTPRTVPILWPCGHSTWPWHPLLTGLVRYCWLCPVIVDARRRGQANWFDGSYCRHYLTCPGWFTVAICSRDLTVYCYLPHCWHLPYWLCYSSSGDGRLLTDYLIDNDLYSYPTTTFVVAPVAWTVNPRYCCYCAADLPAWFCAVDALTFCHWRPQVLTDATLRWALPIITRHLFPTQCWRTGITTADLVDPIVTIIVGAWRWTLPCCFPTLLLTPRCCYGWFKLVVTVIVVDIVVEQDCSGIYLTLPGDPLPCYPCPRFPRHCWWRTFPGTGDIVSWLLLLFPVMWRGTRCWPVV